MSVKEGPTLPPLSVLELNKDLERPRPTQWMRLMLSNLKAYTRLRAGEVGEVPRPVEFKGQVANDMMDRGEQLARHSVLVGVRQDVRGNGQKCQASRPATHDAGGG